MKVGAEESEIYQGRVLVQNGVADIVFVHDDEVTDQRSTGEHVRLTEGADDFLRSMLMTRGEGMRTFH